MAQDPCPSFHNPHLDQYPHPRVGDLLVVCKYSLNTLENRTELPIEHRRPLSRHYWGIKLKEQCRSLQPLTDTFHQNQFKESLHHKTS